MNVPDVKEPNTDREQSIDLLVDLMRVRPPNVRPTEYHPDGQMDYYGPSKKIFDAWIAALNAALESLEPDPAEQGRLYAAAHVCALTKDRQELRMKVYKRAQAEQRAQYNDGEVSA